MKFLLWITSKKVGLNINPNAFFQRYREADFSLQDHISFLNHMLVIAQKLKQKYSLTELPDQFNIFDDIEVNIIRDQHFLRKHLDEKSQVPVSRLDASYVAFLDKITALDNRSGQEATASILAFFFIYIQLGEAIKNDLKKYYINHGMYTMYECVDGTEIESGLEFFRINPIQFARLKEYIEELDIVEKDKESFGLFVNSLEKAFRFYQTIFDDLLSPQNNSISRATDACFKLFSRKNILTAAILTTSAIGGVLTADAYMKNFK